MLEVIKQAWGWTGLEPEEIIGSSEFGNFLVRDAADHFWRICPEELSCEVVARSKDELVSLSDDPEFVADWQMVNLVEAARNALGPLEEGQSYCLKTPGLLGGEYHEANLGKISRVELIKASGSIARQIKDLPDGTKVQFKVID